MLTHAVALLALALALPVTAQTVTSSIRTSSRTFNSTASTTARVQTTITALVGTLTSGFAASVISADACSTILAIQCTDYSIPDCAAVSGFEASHACVIYRPTLTSSEFTATEGPSYFRLVYVDTSVNDGTVAQRCDLERAAMTSYAPVTRATCTGLVLASGDGASGSVSFTMVSTLTDPAQLNYAPIAITAGADNLPVALLGETSCTAMAAAFSSSDDSISAGVIAGATVGGVAGLAITVLLAWYLLVRRRRARGNEEELKPAEPYNSVGHAAEPSAALAPQEGDSHPLRELADEGVNELASGDGKPVRQELEESPIVRHELDAGSPKR